MIGTVLYNIRLYYYYTESEDWTILFACQLTILLNDFCFHYLRAILMLESQVKTS